MPGARRARSLACKIKKHTSVVTTVTPEIARHSLRNGFNGFLRDLLGDRAFCHRRRRKTCPTGLTPASRRQDHTTSPSAKVLFVSSTVIVHRISSRVRDDREPPLLRTRRAGYRFDLGMRRRGIFLRMGLDY
jgi:hypothetical protein